MNAWRLLRSDNVAHLENGDTQHISAEAAWNMHYDADLLEGVRANAIPPTMRLYRWKRPAMTVGRFQNVERTINTDLSTEWHSDHTAHHRGTRHFAWN